MVTLAVVLPVGPNCQVEFVSDTIESVKAFTTPDRYVLLADDSHRGTGERVQARHPDVDVMCTPRRMGKSGGLYLTLSQAFSRVLDTHRFKALLRLDTDALVVGPHPEEDAIACFEADPWVGSAGNYTHEYGGKLRDRSLVADRLRHQTQTLRGLVRRPISGLSLRRVLPVARAHGYELGEEVFGGAAFYSYNGLCALKRRGYLPHRGLALAYLEEDEIFGIALRACGYHFFDLWKYNQSFACSWNSLPASPEELADGPAKVVHSVRDYRTVPERELRAFFGSAPGRGAVTSALAGPETARSGGLAEIP